jgi:transposase InsO family protein
MQRQGLRARPVRRFVRTTDSRHKLPVCRNLLERDFTATAPNQKWAGDITYLWTRSGWVYLAFFMDLFSRKVVGWALSRRIDGELATKALLEAVVRQGYPASVVVHTERGSTYCAGSYREYRDACNLLGSLSRKGDCWDNAVSESFIATLKREEEGLDNLAHDKEAYTVLFDFIECWYNTTRLHSTLGYMSPSEFEKKALPEMQGRTLITPSVF